MAQANDRLDRVILEARRNADKRAAGYRAQALKRYPWVCGGCARTFTQGNLQLLEVHHKNGNHDDNQPDGSNWELLCTYCHEHEHSKLKDMAGRTVTGGGAPGLDVQPVLGPESADGVEEEGLSFATPMFISLSLWSAPCLPVSTM